jgi:hypothetical protein
MGANIAGIYGAQIFRSDDKPKYRRAFNIDIAVLSVGVSLAVLRWVDDKWFRPRRTPQVAADDSNSTDDGTNTNDKAVNATTTTTEKAVESRF